MGITKLKGGPREAKSIVRNGINFDQLYEEGIQNEILEEEKRKEARRTQSVALQPANEILGLVNMGVDTAGMRVTSLPEAMMPSNPNDSDLLIHQRPRPSKAFFES